MWQGAPRTASRLQCVGDSWGRVHVRVRERVSLARFTPFCWEMGQQRGRWLWLDHSAPPQWAGRRECDQALGCSRGPGYFGPLISARKVSYTHPHSPPQSLGHAPPLPHTPTQTQKSCRIVSGKTWADLVPSPGCVPEQESYLLKFSLLICKIKRYLI